jgi:hypothetical protein
LKREYKFIKIYLNDKRYNKINPWHYENIEKNHSIIPSEGYSRHKEGLRKIIAEIVLKSKTVYTQ